MQKFNPLTIWTIILNFFIIVGAGHGLLCIGLLEVAAIFAAVSGHFINDGYFSLSLTASYGNSLGPAAIFSLIGQIIVIVSFYLKGQKYYWTKLSGLLFLWIGFYYLTHNIFRDDLALVGFFAGIPFLICSVCLAYKITIGKNVIADTPPQTDQTGK